MSKHKEEDSSKRKKEKVGRKGKELEYLKRMIKVLSYNPEGLWIREIARQAKLHPEQINRLINKYPEMFQVHADFKEFGINLKIVRLSKDYKGYLTLLFSKEDT